MGLLWIETSPLPRGRMMLARLTGVNYLGRPH
jgi:hypothetical protein